MAKGARLFPMHIKLLFKEFVKSASSNKSFYDKRWYKDLDLFLRTDKDFEAFINDIADNQWMSIMQAIQKYDPYIQVQGFGIFSIDPATMNVLRDADFDFKEVLKYTPETSKKLYRKYYNAIKLDKFNRSFNREQYERDSSKRFADILRRGKT